LRRGHGAWCRVLFTCWMEPKNSTTASFEDQEPRSLPTSPTDVSTELQQIEVSEEVQAPSPRATTPDDNRDGQEDVVQLGPFPLPTCDAEGSTNAPSCRPYHRANAELECWVVQSISALVVVSCLVPPLGPFKLFFAYGATLLFVVASLSACTNANAGRTARYLRRVSRKSDVQEYIARYMEVDPTLEIKCECFRTSSESDRRRVSHRECKSFPFSTCSDSSTECVLPEDDAPVRLRLKLQVMLGDDQSRASFARVREAFARENSGRDAQYDQWYHFRLQGIDNELVAVTDPQHRPWYLSYRLYLLSHVLLLQCVFSLIFRRRTRKVNYTFVKTIIA